MPFNSHKYFIFLPVVFLLYYFAGKRSRWIILLTASFIFYAALNVPYLLVVLALVAMTTFCFGIWLGQAKSAKAKQAMLLSGIVANVLILVVMKYLPFITENLNAFSVLFSQGTQIQPVSAFVAIGVSYYVFQALSYLFDIYLGIEKPERHFGYFALYLSFFPKLLQGPIERVTDLIPQFKEEYKFNYDNMRFGMLLFGWGLFKKVVIADRLGVYVDLVYKDVYTYTGLPLLLATYAYSFQIYMDFSGYTDMALGSARFFNIILTQNFKSPYVATSVADFWRRWHISFSRWILDYIFKPLQMQWRNWKNWGTAIALIVTFLISGLWHGASWGFIIWGGLHGLYMACSIFYKPYQKKIHKSLGIEKSRGLKAWQVIFTLNLVSLTWVFFKASSIKDAVYLLSNVFNGEKGVVSDYLLSQGKLDLLIISFFLMVILFVFLLRRQKEIEIAIFEMHAVKRWLIYYLLFIVIWFFQVSNSQFIYLKF